LNLIDIEGNGTVIPHHTVEKIAGKKFGEIIMTWKNILKQEKPTDREDLEIKLERLLDNFGFDRPMDDYGYMTSGTEGDDNLRVEVEFENMYEGDEDLEEEEIMEMDEGYYRLTFYLPSDGKELAVADYTYDGGYNVQQYTPEDFTTDELRNAYGSILWSSV